MNQPLHTPTLNSLASAYLLSMMAVPYVRSPFRKIT